MWCPTQYSWFASPSGEIPRCAQNQTSKQTMEVRGLQKRHYFAGHKVFFPVSGRGLWSPNAFAEHSSHLLGVGNPSFLHFGAWKSIITMICTKPSRDPLEQKKKNTPFLWRPRFLEFYSQGYLLTFLKYSSTSNTWDSLSFFEFQIFFRRWLLSEFEQECHPTGKLFGSENYSIKSHGEGIWFLSSAHRSIFDMVLNLTHVKFRTCESLDYSEQ